MNNIILCEGFDDAYILGYYLFKTCGWVRQKDQNLKKLPKINKRNQGIEYYSKDNNNLAIWSVGGKDSYDLAFKFISRANYNNPEEGIHRLFIVSDRDDLSITEHLYFITDKLVENGIKITSLENNEMTSYAFEDEGKQYQLDIIPIIIPFDKEGAIETILMSAISEETEENNLIVNMAHQYVDQIRENPVVTTYLQKARQILKAKFSSVISITNPDRSTTVFNTLLTSHEWEKANSIQNHFKALNTYLNENKI